MASARFEWWHWLLLAGGVLLLSGSASPSPRVPPLPQLPTPQPQPQPRPPTQPAGRWVPVLRPEDGIMFQQGRRYRYLPAGGDAFGAVELSRVEGVPVRNVVRTYQLGQLVSAVEFDWVGETGFYERTSLTFDNGERLEVWQP